DPACSGAVRQAGGKFGVGLRSRIDEPAVAGRVGIDVNHGSGRQAQVPARQVHNLNVHLSQALHVLGAADGGRPAPDGFVEQGANLLLAHAGGAAGSNRLAQEKLRAADGRVHVGLDFRLAQRSVVDTDLVDETSEVLA